MNINEIGQFDRRQALKRGIALGAAAVGTALVAGAAEAQSRPVVETTPRTDLPETVEFFYHASEGSIIDEKTGVATVTTRLKEGDIFLAFTQKIGIPDTGWVYEVDSTNRPQEGLVVVIGVTKTITPEGVSNFRYQQYPGRYLWKTRERTNSKGHVARVADITAAGEVQVDRSRIPGNCVPAGCQMTRLVVLNAHEEWNGSKVVMEYDLVSDQDWKKVS